MDDTTLIKEQQSHSFQTPRDQHELTDIRGVWTVLMCLILVVATGCEDDSSGASGLVEFRTTDSAVMMQEMDSTRIPQDTGQGPTETDLSIPESDGGALDTVMATLRVINPGTGQGFSGVTVSGPNGEAVTDASGQASIAVPVGAYRVQLDVTGARTHEVWGIAGDFSFQQITYLSSDMITGFVFGSLGLSDNPDKGILVVGLDTPTLAPAVGAEATIDAASDTPFVFAGIQPSAGNVIPAGGQGFVTFPNVEPGAVRINAEYDQGECRVFPAETELMDVEVIAGQVTVVAFTCRTDME